MSSRVQTTLRRCFILSSLVAQAPARLTGARIPLRGHIHRQADGTCSALRGRPPRDLMSHLFGPSLVFSSPRRAVLQPRNRGCAADSAYIQTDLIRKRSLKYSIPPPGGRLLSDVTARISGRGDRARAQEALSFAGSAGGLQRASGISTMRRWRYASVIAIAMRVASVASARTSGEASRFSTARVKACASS